MKRRPTHLRLVHSAAAPKPRPSWLGVLVWSAPLAVLAASIYAMASYS